MGFSVTATEHGATKKQTSKFFKLYERLEKRKKETHWHTSREKLGRRVNTNPNCDGRSFLKAWLRFVSYPVTSRRVINNMLRILAPRLATAGMFHFIGVTSSSAIDNIAFSIFRPATFMAPCNDFFTQRKNSVKIT